MRTPALLAALLLTSCGPGGPLGSGAAEDYGQVFLYLINANPGASKMKVSESRGTIVDDIGFGERGGDGRTCPPDSVACVPALADRADGELQTKFDRERGVVDLRDDIGGMYPRETGTVVLTGADRGILLRHPQTISSSCGLDVVNALAVDDVDELPRFELAIEMRRTPEEAGFLDESERPFVGPCGELPTNTPEHAQLVAGRTELRGEVASSPWFVVTADRTEAWALPNEDGRSAIAADGTVEVFRDTENYFRCVEAAFTRTAACGAAASWADVTFDVRDVRACADPEAVQALLVPPHAVERLEGDGLCDVTFRARTAGRDLVFGPHASDDLGVHGDGALIETAVETPQGSDRFWVLYGRPVNPRVWQWDSSETFVDLEFFPYPGD